MKLLEHDTDAQHVPLQFQMDMMSHLTTKCMNSQLVLCSDHMDCIVATCISYS